MKKITKLVAIAAIAFVSIAIANAQTQLKPSLNQYFGDHKSGYIYGSDVVVGDVFTMEDMVKVYSQASRGWVNEVIVNSKSAIITIEGNKYISVEEYESQPKVPSKYISMYYSDGKYLRNLKIYFGKGNIERQIGDYKIAIYAGMVCVYKGKEMLYPKWKKVELTPAI